MATDVQSEERVQRFLLHHVTWDAYEQFLAALGERPGLRLNYDGESLEFHDDLAAARVHQATPRPN